tara:strand:+ start:151 stop:615 length:465 start_codon:yes stop_codon:yes gene_type:complete
MIKINVIYNGKDTKSTSKNVGGYIKKINVILNKKLKKYKNKIVFFNLLLSRDNEIKKLNKKFRKKNKTTDVLSFPFYSKKQLNVKLKNEKKIFLGDVIVNLNKIKNKKNKFIFRVELNKLWVHGFAHLLGHDHKMDKDFFKMRKIEKEFLSYIN